MSLYLATDGSETFSHVVAVEKGALAVELDLETEVAGTYVVEVKSQSTASTFKLLKL